MAIKHVVTAGYGFADATIYIPTRGYTPAVVVEGTPITIPVHARGLTVLVPDRGTRLPITNRGTTTIIPEREY